MLRMVLLASKASARLTSEQLPCETRLAGADGPASQLLAPESASPHKTGTTLRPEEGGACYMG